LTDNNLNREFLAIIRHFFREIHGKSFEPNEMVPLTLEEHIGQFYSYKGLIHLEENNIKENAFGTLPKIYNISKLLNGYRSSNDKEENSKKTEIHYHLGNETHIGKITNYNYYKDIENIFDEFKKLPVNNTQEEKELIDDISTGINKIEKAEDKRSAIKVIKDKIAKFDSIRKQTDTYLGVAEKAQVTIGNLVDKLDSFINFLST